MVVVDCSSRVGAAAASQLLLSGPDNMLPGTNLAKASVDLANDILLLSALSSGTLVLNNIHKVCRVQSSKQKMPLNFLRLQAQVTTYCLAKEMP